MPKEYGVNYTVINSKNLNPILQRMKTNNDGSFVKKTLFEDPEAYLTKGVQDFEADLPALTSKLHYNKKTKEYLVLNSISTEVINNEKNKKLIGIDLGLRTFATCLSENETFEINNNENSRLKKLIQKKINLKKLKYTRKNKILLFKINKRIKGLTSATTVTS